jgi:hypothetical protein
MGDALRKDVAVFKQVPAQSVDALRALTHQEIPSSKHDAVRLLLFGLDRNEAHCASAPPDIGQAVGAIECGG